MVLRYALGGADAGVATAIHVPAMDLVLPTEPPSPQGTTA